MNDEFMADVWFVECYLTELLESGDVVGNSIHFRSKQMKDELSIDSSTRMGKAMSYLSENSHVLDVWSDFGSNANSKLWSVKLDYEESD